MERLSLEQVLPEFLAQANKIVWCNLATLDPKNRVRSRVVHPNWEGSVGWMWTRLNSPKVKHLEYNPHVSLAYVADIVNPVYAECTIAWETDPVVKQHVWDFIANTPEPLGYNIQAFYQSPDNPAFGLLKLTPWRLEVVHMPSARKVWVSDTQG
jgi:general stress protein 26